MTGRAPTPRAVALERWALKAFLAFTGVALIGYGAFGLRPQWIPESEGMWAFYQISFPFFGRTHVALSALVLAVVLVRRVGVKWVPAMLAVAGLSFLAEFIGTGFGLPFGEYAYTGLLGFKLGGRVPALIPFSWFVMALPAFVVARAAFPEPGARSARILFAAAALTAWTLALDPAMSFLTPYWTWGESGPYYGMPLINLAGWMITGIVLMGVLDRLGASSWIQDLPTAWMAGLYAAVLAMPLGMCALAGLWGAVAVTVGTVTGLGALAWTRTSSSPRSWAARPALHAGRS